MATIQYEVPNNVQRMTIGVQGENNVREFLFDVTEWRQITGDIGTAEMVVQRNGDASPYAAAITMHDENTVSWIPTATDTAKVGAGKLQLMWIAGGQTVKTKIFDMKVDPSLDYAVPDTSLDPWASWMPGIINADARIKSLETESSVLQGGLSEEISDRKIADNLLQAQIDQIVSPSGEAPSAAEVQNARIGADGFTYDTLGEAIRGQVEGLDNKFDKDPYDAPAVYDTVSGEYVRSSSGAIATDASYSRSDYIDVSNCSSITLYWASTPSDGFLNALCFYDEDKAFVSGVTSPLPANQDSASFNIPASAKYVIFSGVATAMSDVGATLNGITSPIREIYLVKADKKSAFSGEYITDDIPLENVIGVKAKPGNLVNYSECVDGYYIKYDTGGIIAHPDYFATGFIPVTAGTEYRSNVGRNLAWYTADKTYLSGVSGTDIQSGVTAPGSAALIRFTVNKTSDALDNPFGLYFAAAADYDNSVEIDGLKFPAESVTTWCYGKKINWLGDSIVDGQDFDEEVCSALGLVKNTEYGINGSTIALNENGSDGRNALCLRYAQMTDDADIVAVSCGTNDFEYAWSPIGTIDSTENTTFYGALKTLCEGLINKYPDKVIFFTTPIKRAQPFENGHGGEYTEDGVMTTPFSKNKYGKTLGDYADIIKEVCGYYSIPVLDMYRESLLNPHLVSQQDMFDSVYTHPNTKGQKIMARRVAGWLAQLGYIID